MEAEAAVEVVVVVATMVFVHLGEVPGLEAALEAAVEEVEVAEYQEEVLHNDHISLLFDSLELVIHIGSFAVWLWNSDATIEYSELRTGNGGKGGKGGTGQQGGLGGLGARVAATLGAGSPYDSSRNQDDASNGGFAFVVIFYVYTILI